MTHPDTEKFIALLSRRDLIEQVIELQQITDEVINNMSRWLTTLNPKIRDSSAGEKIRGEFAHISKYHLNFLEQQLKVISEMEDME